MDTHTLEAKQAGVDALASMVQQQLDAFARLGHVDAIALFVTRNGRLWRGNPLPPRYKRGRTKQCFANAAGLALRSGLGGPLRYVEGYGLRDDLMLPIHHAWCIDITTGQVIDTTWDDPTHCTYYGVAIEHGLLLDTLASREVYGMFDAGRGPEVEWMRAFDAGFDRAVTEMRARGGA